MPAVKGGKSCSPALLVRKPISGNFALPDCFRPVSCARPLSGTNTAAALTIVKNSRRLMLPSACIYPESITVKSRPNASSACGQTHIQPHEDRVTHLPQTQESKGLPRHLDTLWHSAGMRQSPTSAEASGGVGQVLT